MRPRIGKYGGKSRLQVSIGCCFVIAIVIFLFGWLSITIHLFPIHSIITIQEKQQTNQQRQSTIPTLSDLSTVVIPQQTRVNKLAVESEDMTSVVSESALSLPLHLPLLPPNPSTRLTSDSYQKQLIVHLQQTLSNHPFHKLTIDQWKKFTIADYFVFLQEEEVCRHLPIFISMANVFSELYWQLIENYIYTMVKFGLIDCTVMICVSDPGCIKRCQDASFPCIDFDYLKFHPVRTLPSPLEQIAVLKLYHIPQALEKEVNVMMLDLDVGFLRSPLNLLEVMNPKVDIYLQKDIAYVMNRSRAGWRTWYTVPLPNIGIFYVRGNKKTVKVFNRAWKEYQMVGDARVKNNPGKDQNKFAHALSVEEYRSGVTWKYFPAGSAVLSDMIYKFYDPRFELGGMAAHNLLELTKYGPREDLLTRRQTMGKNARDVGQLSGPVTAVHTTCYEQKTKVMGLKAVNAFWNPFYYDPTRRTITKPLIFLTEEELRDEVRSLFYLAIATNRSIILPNLLGSPQWEKVEDIFEDRALWPAFRTPFFDKNFPLYKDLHILEPAFYWRCARDYFTDRPDLIPSPHVVLLSSETTASVREIEDILLSEDYDSSPRLVLGYLTGGAPQPSSSTNSAADISRLASWAKESVGSYDSYEEELKRYAPLPPLFTSHKKDVRRKSVAAIITKQSRLCKDLFVFDRGNRSCFNKCH